jgi:hypothetical protein
MGPTQIAVKALLDVICDETMDRWIPDEDWVRRIRDNGEHDCSIVNLNRGLSNNDANLEGKRILHNKKNIRITKNEAPAKKSISFYYVLSVGKPAPTIPSDQGFYQSLWDDPDRSNRRLKRRTAPRAKPSSSSSIPPTKRAKATTFRPISPELGPRESPQESESSSDPETFQCAFDMLVVAWKDRYPTVKFPIEKVCGGALVLFRERVKEEDCSCCWSLVPMLAS